MRSTRFACDAGLHGPTAVVELAICPGSAFPLRCRMVRTRSSRSLVALITALLLLMCQTAFAVQACAHKFVPAITDTMSAPCHETSDGSSAPDDKAPAAATSCEVANAVPDAAAKVSVFALADLPAVAVTYLQLPAPPRSARVLQTVQAVCHSPPLSILHCRFLN
jgi:hypothetical protein